MELDKQIEAILFFKGEPLKIKNIAKMLSSDTESVKEALEILKVNLENRGIQLMLKDDEATLGTSKEMSDLILSIRKEELSKDIGKAGLETLSIILYKAPVARSEVDYIRGVNSSFIIRNLLIRGLVERVNNPKDSRSYLYKPSFDLLSFLGISSINDLPEYEKVQQDLQSFVDEKSDGSGSSDDTEDTFSENITK